MASFGGDINGDIIGLRATIQQEVDSPWSSNPNAVYVWQFDETTNQGLIDAYNASPADFRLDGGTLTQNSVDVTKIAPSAVYDAFESLPALVTKMETGQTLTNTELAKLATESFRRFGVVSN